MRRRVRPFQEADADLLEVREIDRRILAGIDVPRFIRGLSRHGPAFTAWADGRPACIGGVFTITDWMGEAWLVTSDLVQRHPLFFHRAVRQYLRLIAQETGFRRVQANVSSLNPASLKWTPRLGFVEEGPLYAYGPGGEDYYRFAWLRRQ